MRKLLFISMLAALIGGYIYFVEVPKVKQELIAGKFFGDVTASEVTSIKVNSTAGEYTLVNNNPHKASAVDPSQGVGDSAEEQTGDLPPLSWALDDMKFALLDRATVEGVTQAVVEFAFSKKVENPESDLAVYGLQPPLASVEVTVAGKNTKILLGERNDFIDGRYAKMEDDSTIYIVDDSLFGEIVKSKEVFRSKTPITFSDSSVRQITIRSGAGTEDIQITPQADKSFKLVTPLKAKASNYAVFDLYRALRNLQVEEFLDSSLTDDFGFTSADEIRIERSVGENLRIKFGAKDKNVYFTVNDQPTIYKAVGDPRAVIFKPVVSFRDAQPFKFDPYLATSVVVTREKEPVLSLRSEQGSWVFTSDQSKADAPFVREFLKTLGDLKVQEFLPMDDTQWVNSPYITVEVTIDDDGQKTAKKLLIGTQKGQTGYPALVVGSDEPFFISVDSVKQITPAEERFKIVPTPAATAQAAAEQ